jgi:hypothetical protein
MLNKYIITIQQLKPNHWCWFWSHLETMPWDHNNLEYTANESSELNADNMGCQTFLNKNQIDHLETKGRPKHQEVSYYVAETWWMVSDGLQENHEEISEDEYNNQISNNKTIRPNTIPFQYWSLIFLKQKYRSLKCHCRKIGNPSYSSSNFLGRK